MTDGATWKRCTWATSQLDLHQLAADVRLVRDVGSALGTRDSSGHGSTAEAEDDDNAGFDQLVISRARLKSSAPNHRRFVGLRRDGPEGPGTAYPAAGSCCHCAATEASKREQEEGRSGRPWPRRPLMSLQDREIVGVVDLRCQGSSPVRSET